MDEWMDGWMDGWKNVLEEKTNNMMDDGLMKKL